MKKSIYKVIIAVFLLLRGLSPLFCQEDLSSLDCDSFFDSEISHFNIQTYTLQNGFNIFVKEDNSQALVKLELAVKAGFNAQNAENSGFFPLYTEILYKNSQTDNNSLYSQITSSCNSDCAIYSIETTPDTIEKAFQFISEPLKDPFFTDDILKAAYEKMKQQVSDYAESTTGFVNSAIDGIIFSEEPWKQDSGIYPSLFNNYTLSKVRTILLNISKEFYTPQNSALFINGNIDGETISLLAEKYFSSWKKRALQRGQTPPPNKTEQRGQTPPQQKKFVLTEESFSEELTQIIIQFTTLNQNETDILSASFTGISSPYKKNILAEERLSVRGSTYLTAASAQKSGITRLILQAIMEPPYSLSKEKKTQAKNITVAEQASIFLEKTKEASVLEPLEFSTAKSIIKTKYRSITGNSSSLMSYLAEIWASEINFTSLDDEKAENLAEKITNEEPYVFLLVNPEIYKEQKKSFEKEGYRLITKENASWYKNELLVKKALSKKPEEKKENQQELNSSPAQDYFISNESQITQTFLKNNIPVVIKQNHGSENAVISIAISGGELSSPKEERFLRTVLINSFAQNIQARINKLKSEGFFCGNTNIQAWTEETVSYITISCIKDDLSASMNAVTEAILFGEVTPVNADSLVYEQKIQWNQKSANLNYQLTCAALSSLFSGTKYEKLFDATTSILKRTTYRTFSLDYLQLLDSSLYSIVATGDITPEEFVSAAENTFGILKQQTKRSSEKIEFPEFSNTIRKVKLRHTFTTDIPAEQAGPAPETLIPTTDFTDPVQFWFAVPSSQKEQCLFNAILFEFERRIQSKLGKTETCSSQSASYIIQAACIQCDGIEHTRQFLNAYTESQKEIRSLIEKSDSSIVASLKQNWILREMSKTSTEEGTASLIQKGLLSGNSKQYLENYCTIENASSQDFLSILRNYFPAEPAYQVYSADSKN